MWTSLRLECWHFWRRRREFTLESKRNDVLQGSLCWLFSLRYMLQEVVCKDWSRSSLSFPQTDKICDNHFPCDPHWSHLYRFAFWAQILPELDGGGRLRHPQKEDLGSFGAHRTCADAFGSYNVLSADYADLDIAENCEQRRPIHEWIPRRDGSLLHERVACVLYRHVLADSRPRYSNGDGRTRSRSSQCVILDVVCGPCCDNRHGIPVHCHSN